MCAVGETTLVLETIILQKKSLRTNYENDIYLKDIRYDGGIYNSVGYCEELVEIPREFFAFARRRCESRHGVSAEPG